MAGKTKTPAAKKVRVGGAEMVSADPPKQRAARGRYDWQAIADQLRSTPNQWWRVFEGDLTSLVTSIRISTPNHPLHASKGFVIRTANNQRGIPGEVPRTCDLWMCYDPSKEKN